MAQVMLEGIWQEQFYCHGCDENNDVYSDAPAEHKSHFECELSGGLIGRTQETIPAINLN
ncbi:hypothetical protein D3C76_1558720 [compost metagenome]